MEISRRRLLQASALGGMAVAAHCALPAAAVPKGRHTRTDDTPELVLGERKRVATAPMVFAEVQYKYSHYQNPAGIYPDRPLYFDRSLRPNSTAFNTAESYFRDVEIARRYRMDGLGSLAVPILNFYQEVMDWLDSDPDRAGDHLEFPQLAPTGWYSFSTGNASYQQARTVLARALKSSFTPRIDGRIPMATYNTGYFPLDVVKQYLDALKEEFGDTFAVMGQLVVDWEDGALYDPAKGWSTEVQRKYVDRISDMLAVFDGIQLEMPIAVWRVEYAADAEFGPFDRYLIPMVKDALAKPENSRKLLCGQVRQGYENTFTMVTNDEQGTARMRHALDRLVALNPDVVFLFEWNEFNENTCFQPTVRNGLALQRLIGYYSDILKGRTPTPMPGDDTSLPQLVLTHRDEFKLGERMQFELLNIPDGSTGRYSAHLTLHDADGQLVHDFGVETFERARMRAVSYSLPTENLSREYALQPRLTLVAGGRTRSLRELQAIALNPTVSKRYFYIRQSIRDMLVPEAVSFEVTQRAGGFALSGRITTEAPLMAVEVTENGRDFYAVDVTDEYELASHDVLLCEPSSRTSRWVPLAVRIHGVADWEFIARDLQRITAVKRDGTTVTATMYAWVNRNGFYLKVPKAAPPDAMVEVTVEGETHAFRLGDLRDLNRYAHIYFAASDRDTRLDWQMWRAEPDVAPWLGTNSATFNIVLPSHTEYPVYQLRAIDVDGRIYRGAMRVPNRVHRRVAQLNVISETSGEIVKLQVPDVLVPKLDYQLGEARVGETLLSGTHEFDGQLGGGIWYEEPFFQAPLVNGIRHAPERVVVDGRQALSFANEQSWANFPIEAFPRGAFTLTMDLKPATQGQYVLWRHFSWILGSVTVFVDGDGQLVASFGDRQPETSIYPSGITVRPDTWQRVEIRSDLRKYGFKVGNLQSKVAIQPGPKAALYAKPSAFGGHVKPEFGLPEGYRFYTGLLSRLQLSHNANNV